MGWLQDNIRSSRRSSYMEQRITSLGRLLSYREPEIPRALVVVRRISWPVALVALLITLTLGFFLRDYARYGLPHGGPAPGQAWVWLAALGVGILFAVIHVVSAALVQRRWRRVADRLLEHVPSGEDPTEYLDPALLRKFVSWPASMSAGCWLVAVFLSTAPFFALGGYRNPLMGPLDSTDPLAVGLMVAVVILALCLWVNRAKHRRYGAWPQDSALYSNSPSGQ